MEEKLEREQADEAGRLSTSQGFLGCCHIDAKVDNNNEYGKSIIFTCCIVLTVFTMLLMFLMKSTTIVMKASLAGLTSTSALAATSTSTTNQSCATPLFMVDNGASEHICSNIDFFQEIDTSKSKQFR
eukprot:5469576-Pyramimonas_sp.AAC.1